MKVKEQKFKIGILLIVLSAIFKITQSAVVNYISEFISDDIDDQTDVDNLKNWNIKLNSGKAGKQMFSICGKQKGRKLVGGYMVFTGYSTGSGAYEIIQKTEALRNIASPITPYWSYSVKAKIFKIDSWNDEKLEVYTNYQLSTENKTTVFFDSCFDQLDICGSKTAPGDPDYNYAYNDGIYQYQYNTTSNKLKNFKIISFHNAEENESFGFREFIVDIDSCHPSCKSCNGPNDNQCLTCFNDAQLNSSNGCECKKNNMKIQLSNINQCYTSSTNFENCNLCLNICLPGQYEKILDNNQIICSQCDNNCKTCVSSSTNCLACEDSFYLSSNQNGVSTCKKCHPSCQTCSSYIQCNNCSDGYYSLSQDSESTCIKCNDQCSKCRYRADNCVECSLGYYLVSYKGQIFCQQCPANCEQCLYDEILMKPICKKCEIGSYLIISTGICTNSPLNCGLNQFGLDSERTCVSQCPAIGYFADKQLQKCIECHPYCQSCFERYQTHCTSCKEGFLLDGMTCTKQCLNPSQKIPDTVNGDCNYYYLRTVGTQVSCKIACQQGSVYYEYRYSCIKCENNCYNCIIEYGLWKDSIVCIECQYPFFLTNGQCLEKCPSGQFADILTLKCLKNCSPGFYKSSGVCLKCMSGCIECTSNSSCINCGINWNPILDNNIIKSCICENGYSQNYNTNECVKCGVNCNKCDPLTLKCIECTNSSGFQVDPLTNQCTLCKEGYKKVGSACIICEEIDYQNQICKCQDKCETCNSQSSCVLCKNKDPNIEQSSCMCKQGYSQLEIGKVCIRCGEGCEQCQSELICLKCSAGFYLDNNYQCTLECKGIYYPDDINMVCSTKCPNGKFGIQDGQNKCEDCSPLCEQCSQSKDNCTVCQDNYYRIMQNNIFTCVQDCPNRYFKVENPMKECLPCNNTLPYCSECSSDGKACSKCLDNYYLSNKKCVPCIRNCAQCQNTTSCMKCSNGYEYISNINSCLKICEVGQFRQTGSTNCTNCNRNCSSCSLNASNCLDCASGFSKQNGICVEGQCQDGYYLKQGDIYCSKCHVSCKKCQQSERQCTECSDNFQQKNSNIINGCEPKTCENGYFFYNSECKECIQDCKECFNTTECSVCNEFYQLVNKTCQKIICQQTSCENCNEPTVCTDCKNGFKLSSQSKQCECELNQYFDSLTNTCKQCSQECETCLENNKKCTKCNLGYEQFPLNSNTCLEICQEGTYRISADLPCQACSSSCKSCKTNLNTCQSCFEGFELIQNKCIEKCKFDYFRDPNNNSCMKCSNNCLKCQNSFDYCISCPPQFNLVQTGQISFCRELCQEGFYFPKEITESRTCQKCDNNCKSCQDTSDNCITCADKFSFQDFGGILKCKQNCLNQGTEIGLPNSLFCEKCDSNCKECKDTITNCVSCNTKFDLNNGKCIPQCPEGEYLPENSLLCQKCDDSCKSCQNSPRECIDCSKGYSQKSVRVLLIENSSPYDTGNNITLMDSQIDTTIDQSKYCFRICQQGQYLTEDNICNECYYQICKTCVDNQYKCTSCYQNQRYDPQLNTCIIEKCEDGQFLEEVPINPSGSDPINSPTKRQQCTLCDSSCKTCQNSKNNCTSCQNAFDLIEGKCLPSCLQGEFRNVDKICKPCNQICKTCIDNEINCTSCQDGMENIGNTCLLKCQDSEFRDNLLCTPCNSKCKKCNINSNNCTECNIGQELINNFCYLSCQTEGQFRNNIQECVNCNPSCKKCSESPNNCSECKENFQLIQIDSSSQKKECLPICKSNEFLNISSKQCDQCNTNCLTCESLPIKCKSCPQGFDLNQTTFICEQSKVFQSYSMSIYFFISMVSLTLMMIQQILNPKNVYGLYSVQLIQILGSFISQYQDLELLLANDYFSALYQFNLSPLIPFNLINSVQENLDSRYFSNELFQNNTIFHTVMIIIIFMIAVFYRNWTKQYGKLFFKIISITSNLYIFSAFYQMKNVSFSSEGFIIWNYINMIIFLIAYSGLFFFIYYKNLYLLYSEIENKYFYHILEARKILGNLLIVFLPLKYSFCLLILNILIGVFFIKSNPITLPNNFKHIVASTEIIYLITNLVLIVHSQIKTKISETILIAFLFLIQIYFIIIFIFQFIRSYLIRRAKNNPLDLDILTKYQLNISSSSKSGLRKNSMELGLVRSPSIQNHPTSPTKKLLQSIIRQKSIYLDNSPPKTKKLPGIPKTKFEDSDQI